VAKVLLITQNFPPETSAAANRLGAMAEALAERHELTVVGLRPSFPDPSLYDSAAVRAHDVALPYRVRRAFCFMPHRGSFVVRALREHAVSVLLAGAAARERADVVLTSSPIMFLAPAAWALARVKSAKFVWDVRDVTWLYARDASGAGARGLLAALLERYMWFVARRADLIAVPTPGSRELFIEHGTPARRVIVVENTISQPLIDALQSSQHPPENERPVVTYAGVIGHMQDLGALVAAAGALPDVDFVIAGDGPDRRALEEQARERRLANVQFTGYVKREQLREIYRRTDILFGSMRDQPTFNRATVPSKLLEYMAIGRPILFAGGGIAGDLVEEAECGVAVAPDDAAEIGAAIRSLLSSRGRMEELGANGRRFVARTPNRETVMANFARALEAQLAASA
jgi:colanic acid biosynthesis glycosyl transferase WcaI